jgi:WD40 repeat protein
VLAGAQFFHGDRLLLVGCGTAVGLYGYALQSSDDRIDTTGAGRDNKPRLPQGRYRRAHTYMMSGKPALTALAAVNGTGLATRSIFVAGSSKSLELIDVNASATSGNAEITPALLCIPAAHNRPVHCIALPLSSSVDGSTFLTTATDGAMKLWDVRCPGASRGECVQLWSSHTNRVHRIGAALSPCGRFAACGSEDKLAYVYDLRRSSSAGVSSGGQVVLWKLRGHKDSVLDVAFSPVHPQLATVGADGKVLFFCDG